MKTRSEVVKLVNSWEGKNEADGSHKEIIDIYNSHKPWARGYKMPYDQPWCAVTTSSLAIALGYTDIIPVECSCYYLIEKAKNMGIWIEADNHIPKIADFVLYDWNDNGKGDNVGVPKHIGTVIEVNEAEGYFIVKEGNYNNAVKNRKMSINGKYIRGFICPKYDAEPTQSVPKPTQTPVSNSKFNQKVEDFQKAAIADGFSFPKYGVDGEWGNECKSVARVAVVKERKSGNKWVWKYPNLTRLAQRLLGFTGTGIDGKCGNNTGDRIEDFQEEHGLVPDRCIGIYTWEELLGV